MLGSPCPHFWQRRLYGQKGLHRKRVFHKRNVLHKRIVLHKRKGLHKRNVLQKSKWLHRRNVLHRKKGLLKLLYLVRWSASLNSLSWITLCSLVNLVLLLALLWSAHKNSEHSSQWPWKR